MMHLIKKQNQLNSLKKWVISSEKLITFNHGFIPRNKRFNNLNTNDINETNENQLKDIISLIDCIYCDKLVVESYIDVTKTILKNYFTNNDRIGVFFLLNEYRIICPIMSREEIDISNFKKDLDIYWEKVFRKEKIEYSSRVNEEIQERINSGESFDSIPESRHNSFSDSSSDFNNKGGFINKKKIKIEYAI